MQVQNPGSYQKTYADRFAWSSLRSLKKAPIRKIWSPQDPRPLPRVDEVTKNFNGYQPAINNWGTKTPRRVPQKRVPRPDGPRASAERRSAKAGARRKSQARSQVSGRCRTLQQKEEPSNKDTRLKGKPNPTGHAAIRGKTWPNHRGPLQADILYGLRTMISI
ncbi:hypothetical protein Bca101_082779 [Brassica carinata]